MKYDKLAGPGNSEITNPVFEGTPLKALLAASPTEFLSVFIPRLVGISFVIGVLIFLFMFLAGGIQWISSGGDKGGLEAAKGRITSALIGVIILFSSFAIIQLVESFFGIKILTIDIGPLVI